MEVTVAYYMGDRYRGDFYMGDPGIWQWIVKGARAALPHVPFIGPVLQNFTRFGARGAPSLPSAAGAAAGAIVRRAGQAVVQHPVLTAAGAAAGVGVAAAEALGMGRPSLPTKGYHIIRKGPHAGKLTKNRRMRPTNPRALRRSLRRVAGFARIARRVMHFTHPRARGRMVYRFARRKKR